ncbi:hypothetical protein [Micromonospora arida]|uniref:hypothetical protein n=1 Tax=Micromonospora arida TaxID=2203715 RepID=UPI003CEB9E2F
MVDVLRLEPLLFPAEFTSHRMRILVNGLDVVATAYPANGFHGQPVAGFGPSRLLGPDGLAVAPEAREIAVDRLGHEDLKPASVHQPHRRRKPAGRDAAESVP